MTGEWCGFMWKDWWIYHVKYKFIIFVWVYISWSSNILHIHMYIKLLFVFSVVFFWGGGCGGVGTDLWKHFQWKYFHLDTKAHSLFNITFELRNWTTTSFINQKNAFCTCVGILRVVCARALILFIVQNVLGHCQIIFYIETMYLFNTEYIY